MCPLLLYILPKEKLSRNHEKCFSFHPKSFFGLAIFIFCNFFPFLFLVSGLRKSDKNVIIMTSRFSLHKLAKVIFGITQETLLKHQNCLGVRSLKGNMFATFRETGS